VVYVNGKVLGMFARPGRPPKMPTGESSTLTIRLPAEIKRHLIETSVALDLSITEYLITLIRRDAADL
jgi:hypothetical protein